MSWDYHEDTNEALDDLIGDLIDQLVEGGGWTEPDPGYDVVHSEDGNFDVYIRLETTNKRYIQYDVGVWDAVGHVIDTGYPHYRCGHIIADMSSSFPAGTEVGIMRLSFDDTYFALITDYKANGADWRRCFSYIGFATPRDASDEVLTIGATLYRGTNAVPTNDGGAGEIIVFKDVNGAANYKTYACYILAPITASGITNFAPHGQMLEAVANQRDAVEIFLASYSALSVGEASGIRAKLQNCYHGFADDAEANGATIDMPDGKVLYYFIQADELSYSHLPTRILIRYK